MGGGEVEVREYCDWRGRSGGKTVLLCEEEKWRKGSIVMGGGEVAVK